MQVQTNVPFAQRLDLTQIVGHDCDNESYNRVPISNFGLDMLKSMGWQEGKGIGKNPQFALVKPIVYIPNYERAGLGAHRAVAPLLKKRRHLNKATEHGVNGKGKNYLEIGGERAKKVEKNAKIRIISGKYEGLKGVVVEINEEKKQCCVELEINEDLVKVDLNKVKLLDTIYDQEYMESDIEERFTSGRGNPDVVESSEEGSLFMDESVKGKKRAERKSKKVDKAEKRRLKWISPHIWVRVVSKKVRDGRLYERRVYVTDILDEYSFSAIDEKGNVVDDLREKDVETILPKANGLVKVLVGEHKEKIAVLLERDRKRNKIQVQLVDTLEIEDYTQDDCSMYEEKM